MTEKELLNSIEIFAHKIRNPIHAAGINLDVLKTKLNKKLSWNDDIFKHLNIVSTDIEKINDIIAKYFNYLKLCDKEKQKTDLKKLLERK